MVIIVSFTDDDLKRLKERAEHHDWTTDMLFSHPIFESLLARLDCAERVIEKSGCGCCADYDELREAKQDWRASCGALYPDEKKEYKQRKSRGEGE